MSSVGSTFQDIAANNVLNILHNSVRLFGNNIFTLPVNLNDALSGTLNFDDPASLLTSEEGAYYTGLATAPIIMIVVFVVWLLLLCTAWCCTRCPFCVPTCQSMFLVGSIVMSSLAWFISLRGNNLLQSGILEGFQGAQEVGNLLLNTSDLLINVLDLEADLNDTLEDVEFNCGFAAATANVDLSILPDAEIISNTLTDPQQIIEGIQPVIEEGIAFITPFLERVTPVYNTFVTGIIGFLGVFGICAVFKFLFDMHYIGRKKNCLVQLNSCITRFGCIFFFTFGFIFVLLIWIFAIILAPIATLGADLCLPDITTNVLNEFAEVTSFESSDEFCEITDPIDFGAVDDIQNALDSAGGLICHYARCEGVNILLETAGIQVDGNDVQIAFVDELISEIQAAKDALIQGLVDNGLPPDIAGPCDDSLDASISLVEDVSEIAKDAVLLFTCDNITPIVRLTLDESLCNGIISGLAVVYVTWTTGTAGMMLTMYCFCLLDCARRKREKQEKGDEYLEDEPESEAMKDQEAGQSAPPVSAEPVIPEAELIKSEETVPDMKVDPYDRDNQNDGMPSI